MKKETITILLADDDVTDRELFISALKLSGFNYNLIEASNGQEVIDYLNNETFKIPDFILLDLNMPIMDGRETLTYLKTSEKFKVIPVLIMSTSSSSYDVRSSYESGTNLFLVKPDDFNELTSMVKSLLSIFKIYIAIPEIK